MSLMEDFNNGSKAYYEEVPRYKNPYSGSNHFDDANYEAWEKGWKQSSAEHRLFTENQELKQEKKSREIEKMNLNSDLDFAQEQVERFKEDKATFVLAFKISCERIDAIDKEARSLISYIEGTNKFLFSRGKMLSRLKKLLKEDSPEVEKRKSK